MVSTTETAYLIFLAAVGLERLFELGLARRNAQRAFEKGAVEVGQGHFKVMAILHTAFLVACAAETLLLDRAFPGALGVVALLVALAAQGLRYWAIATLGDRWNTRIIVLPMSDPVTSGPYRLMRHPNYLAVIAELAAIPLIHGAYLTAVVFSVANALLLNHRIRAEEAALGQSYSARFAHIPRFFPRSTREG